METKIYAVGSIVHAKEVIDGKIRRRTIAPLTPRGEPTDISNEPKEVRAACNEAWTSELIAAHKAHKEAAI